MILTVIASVLPPICIAAVGMLLIIIPQQEAQAKLRQAQRKFLPGNLATTTSGFQGFIVTSTKTHVVLCAHDGQKQEFLKRLVTPHETGV